ncbi:NAD(+) diphosphatase [Inquilinus sp. CAU 1745]|uniref:NAD(+) diphosphatase n=1 Tax=Inquilinus sp. CAU 1745 TaxID=3140369 RepID=UPI00325ACB98
MSHNVYDHPTLDRLAERRRDPAWIAERLAAPETVILPVWQGKNLIDGPREAPHVARLSGRDDWWRPLASEIALLGESGGRVWFAADLSALPEPATHERLAALGLFVDLRAIGPILGREDAALLAYARGLMWWHQRHRFCGVCGHRTESGDAGHVRRCTNAACAINHFPRTDPAVIVLVHDGDRCLMGRQSIWPKGMHSTLAGFVEPGESLEAAVMREVFEESGVRVGDVRYHSSQPWPFPQSLMIGFTACAETTDIVLRDGELEGAGWFDRSFLRAVPPDAVAGEADFVLSRRDSIARRLVDDWIWAD